MYFAYISSISKNTIVVDITETEKGKPLCFNPNLVDTINFIPLAIRMLSGIQVQGYVLIDIYLTFPYDNKPAGLFSSTLHALNIVSDFPPAIFTGVILLIGTRRSINSHRKLIRYTTYAEVMLTNKPTAYQDYICLTGDTIEEIMDKARQQAKDIYPESYRIHVKCYMNGLLINERGFNETHHK